MMSSVSIVLSLALVIVVKCQDYQPIATGIAADQCFEPVSTGHCRARFPSFHYNPLTETCDCFIFGGCAANGNKFATLHDCMSTCGVNPQLQTISSTCISIFGTENAKLTVTPQSISPRPVVFSLGTNPQQVVTIRDIVTVKASPSTEVPKIDAPTTVATSTDSPTTAATSTDAQTTATTSTVAPTIATLSSISPAAATSTASTPSKPTSTPGPWDHWYNI